jgi:hypothetical protein
VDALKPGDDGDFLAFRETPDQCLGIDVEDSRRAVHLGRCDRQLPALPGARIDVEVLEHDREQSGGDLLAGGDNHIIFAGIKNAPLLKRLLAPRNELIGGAGHRRDHDGHLIAGVDLALDVARDVADAVEIGDRSSAEFHYEASHGGRYGRGVELRNRTARRTFISFDAKCAGPHVVTGPAPKRAYTYRRDARFATWPSKMSSKTPKWPAKSQPAPAPAPLALTGHKNAV